MSNHGYTGSTIWDRVYVGDKAASAVYLGTNHIWGPEVGDPIEFIDGSIGTGRNAAAGSSRSAIGSMLIDEDAFDRLAIAFVGVSHHNWINDIGGYGGLSLSSHLNGAFIQLGSAFFGRGGNEWQTGTSCLGSITAFILPNPSVGLHTITAFCPAPYQWINQIQFQVQAYKNVLAASSPTLLGNASQTPWYLDIGKPSAAENLTLCGMAHSELAISTGYLSQPRRGSTIGGPVDGAGDYLTVLESNAMDALPGGQFGPLFQSQYQDIYGVALVNLIGYPQA